MGEYLKLVAEQLGIPLFLFVILVIWASVWKILALWKAARKKSLVWFIVLAVVNTLGILEILYIFIFSDMKHKRKEGKVRKKRRR
jgi:predicted permease